MRGQLWFGKRISGIVINRRKGFYGAYIGQGYRLNCTILSIVQ